MPGLVEVAPLPPVPLHDLLTYEVPPALSAGVRPGVRVRIPLGRQVRAATDHAVNACGRLAGAELPTIANSDASIP